MADPPGPLSGGEGPSLAVTIVDRWVAGSTARQLTAVLDAVGPVRHGQRFHAYTDWEVRWSHGYRRAPGGVAASGVRVEVAVTLTLPRWDPPPSVASGLRARWEAYLAALRRHEQGHVDLAMEAGNAIHEALFALPAEPSPSDLDRAAEAAAAAVLARVRAEERRYDEVTSHGAAEAALRRGWRG